jgi:hypothetical protein
MRASRGPSVRVSALQEAHAMRSRVREALYFGRPASAGPTTATTCDRPIARTQTRPPNVNE